MSHHRKNENKDENKSPACGPWGCEGEKPQDVEPKTGGPREAESKPAAEQPVEASGEELDLQYRQLKNQLLRVSADYQNYQKRMLKQLEQTHQVAQESMVRSLLPVIDNFENAINSADKVQDIKTLLEGVRIIYQHIIMAMGGFGLKKIPVKPGDPFDHNVHEAVLHEPNSEFPENTIVRELASGYMMNDRPLRPAKVSVAKAPEEKQETE